MSVLLKTGYGLLKGNKRENCREFLGIRYARAGRFEYAVPVDHAGDEGEYDAMAFGGVCPQIRAYHEHLEIPERLFYHNEFREGIIYDYDEDCLNLNIYTPFEAENAPVIIFIHGGGFDSGSVRDSCFDGDSLCRRGIILVTINYRVGVLGYLTHEEIRQKYGHSGNFGLDDQLTAIKWVRRHIKDFGGDPDNITLMGQSAGAISIQYLCLMHENEGLFRHAVMMSGGGLFPKFALPRPAEKTAAYWLDFMKIAGCATFEELKKLDLKSLYDAVDEIKKIRKDNVYNTMPVVDGYLIKAPVDELIKEPLKIDYMIGYTNNDMYAALMAHIGNKFASANNGYVYYFDIDAPGDDKNGAFHSSDLRYMFHTLSSSRRPYGSHDYEVSELMMDYVSSFATDGDPNREGRPVWERKRGRALCIGPKDVRMGRPNCVKLIWNTITKGDPK
ncbi:MAG: carboxylesterase family protein [Lachnospiraceae bacterium]|nr:carboxylesterase family protein [Lachnospiraceae bacterium]